MVHTFYMVVDGHYIRWDDMPFFFVRRLEYQKYLESTGIPPQKAAEKATATPEWTRKMLAAAVEGERKIRSTNEIDPDRDPKRPKEAKEIVIPDRDRVLTIERINAGEEEAVLDLREIEEEEGGDRRDHRASRIWESIIIFRRRQIPKTR